MNINCPKCDTVVPTDVRLSVCASDEKTETGGICVNVGIESIDYTPWEAHYAAVHA